MKPWIERHQSWALRMPLGFLGLLILVAGIERFLTIHEGDFDPDVVWDWKISARAARRKAPGQEILCFGDSTAKLAVQPGVIKAKVGRSTYNLAIAGGQPPSAYFLLRRALEAGARPAAVVMECNVALLREGPEHNERRWPELVSPLECMALARQARDARFVGTLALGMLLPSFRDRNDIRAHVKRVIQGREDLLYLESLAFRRNWRRNSGAQLFARKLMERDMEVPAGTVFPHEAWRCHPVNASFLRRFLRLAADRGIPVFWLLPPVTPGLQHRLELQGFDQSFTTLVRRLAGQYPNITVVDGRRAGYPLSVFFDALHIHRHGAEVLSSDLAEILDRCLKQGPPPGRWVNLPRYRELPKRLDLEDINRSRVVMWQATRERR
jgi:hypothetical protein